MATKFIRVIPPKNVCLELEYGFDQFWDDNGLVCHMMSLKTPQTFDEIYETILSYYSNESHKIINIHDETDVAMSLIRLIEWGLVETVKGDIRNA